MYINGESPQETKKLVAPEQIEHGPKFSVSEVMNSELINNSESLKGRVTYQKSANV